MRGLHPLRPEGRGGKRWDNIPLNEAPLCLSLVKLCIIFFSVRTKEAECSRYQALKSSLGCFQSKPQVQNTFLCRAKCCNTVQGILLLFKSILTQDCVSLIPMLFFFRIPYSRIAILWLPWKAFLVFSTSFFHTSFLASCRPFPSPNYLLFSS